MTDYLPPGVYLNLDAKTYFAQDCMGSSDWIDVDRRGAGWWWKSKWNKRRRPAKTKLALTYGSALHVIVLEGVRAYERAYAVAPDPQDFPGLVTTEREIKAKLAEKGYVLTGTSKYTKDDWNAEMLTKLPDVPCWDNILEDFAAVAGKKTPIDAITDFELRFLRQMAISEDRNDNAEVRRLLAETDEHPVLAEVSVFAEIDGIRRRWRFDRLYPAAIMDLKSLASWSGRPLEWEAGDVIGKRRWSIQRADYGIHGRRELFKAVREGRVYGGTLEQRRYLEDIVAEQTVECPFLWCVYEKPDSVRGVAPVFMPIMDAADSELLKAGEAKLDKAIRTFKGQVAQWGLDTPWGRVERLHYTTERNGPGGVRLPQVFIPAYAFDIENPAQADAYEEDSE